MAGLYAQRAERPGTVSQKHPSKGKATTLRRERIMKTLASALIALAVLAGIMAPIATGASAFDAKSFFEQQERDLP
jgi:hypothetical protein